MFPCSSYQRGTANDQHRCQVCNKHSQYVLQPEWNCFFSGTLPFSRYIFSVLTSATFSSLFVVLIVLSLSNPFSYIFIIPVYSTLPISLKRPVAENGLCKNRIFFYEMILPVPGIQTVITIIPHHKIAVFWNFIWSEVSDWYFVAETIIQWLLCSIYVHFPSFTSTVSPGRPMTLL